MTVAEIQSALGGYMTSRLNIVMAADPHKQRHVRGLCLPYVVYVSFGIIRHGTKSTNNSLSDQTTIVS